MTEFQSALRMYHECWGVRVAYQNSLTDVRAKLLTAVVKQREAKLEVFRKVTRDECEDLSELPWETLRLSKKHGDQYAIGLASGVHQHDVAEELCALASILDRTVSVDFNGVTMAASVGVTPNGVVEDFLERVAGRPW